MKESIDLCALYGNDTLYLDCFHTLAILQRYSGKHDLAMDSYKKTYIVFEHIFENNKLDHWTYLLFDMAISIKSLHYEFCLPPKIWLQIASLFLSTKLRQLLEISNDAIEEYIETEEPISLPFLEEGHIYFPKI